MQNKKGEKTLFKTVLAGGISGAAGQYVCNPLFIVKTHQQSQASASIAVGHQHEKAGMVKSLAKIYKQYGVRP